MKKITPQILLVLLLLANIFAQSEKSQPQLIEEFGLIPTSHWYNFLYGVGQQYKDSESNLLIKIQGNPHKSLLYPFVFGARMKAHFVGNMKFDGEKIFVQNCDLEKGEIKVQIFQLSENSIIPKCNDEIPVPKETFLFKSRHFENPYVQYEDIYEIPGQEEAISKISYKILNKLLKKTPDSRIILIGYLGTNYCSGNCLDKKVI